MIEIVFYSGIHCSLCDRLDQLIRPHLEDLRRHTPVELIKRDVGDDSDWRRLYATRIPVLTCGGKVVLEGRPEPEQVAQAFACLLSGCEQ